MKVILLITLLAVPLIAQDYKAVNIKGEVKFQTGTSEEWVDLEEGVVLKSDAFVATGEKSSVKLTNAGTTFILNELSALSVGSIKTISTDELLLALAMEDMINAPRTNHNGSSGNTATYGNKENEKDVSVTSDDFGIMRLNGAVQLANSGLKESAVIFAKETFRKYPDTRQMAKYRIFFADILNEKGLYEEALGEYFEIEKLDLRKEEKTNVESQINAINKILLNN